MSKPLPESIQRQLISTLGAENVLADPAECVAYSYDNSRKQALPDAVVYASTHEQIQAVVSLCYQHAIPLTVRGRGTNTIGATVPLAGGIVLALERMEKIISIDPDNRVIVAEPGVLNQTIQNKAAEYGFFWPPDPSSGAYCAIGGNLGCNAAGPRALKYGSCRENTLGLRAVTGTGETIHTGVYTTKGTVGYDFTRLLIGSEGTLAIITEAILKLTPLPESKTTFEAFYRDMRSATSAVAKIMAQPMTPCALEFIDGKAIQLIRQHNPAVEMPSDAQATLIIEVDGPKSAMAEAQQAITKAATNTGMISIFAAETNAQVQAIWARRKTLSPALRSVAPQKINEDIVVPVANMPTLIDAINQLAEQYQLNIINFGHAGNGNIHVNLLFDPNDPQQQKNADICLERIFDLVIKLQGTLSGEHGVGIAKRDFMTKAIDPVTLGLMRKIKAQFDPKGILNPGKLFPQRW